MFLVLCVRRSSASTAYQTEEEKKEALLLYYLHTMPMASWQNVAGALHYQEGGDSTAGCQGLPETTHQLVS